MLVGSSLVVIGLGAVAFVASVFVGAPYLARGGARASRPLLERFGIEGRLAVDNSVRSPKRTATTANALLIGVFLVTLVAVAGASIRDFAIQQVNDLQSADYVVVSKGGTIDDDFVAKLRDVKDVNEVVAFRAGAGHDRRHRHRSPRPVTWPRWRRSPASRSRRAASTT